MQFVKGIGGTSAEQGDSIQVDSSGNSYVTGYFGGTVDFDPGAGTVNLTSAGNQDIFIAKYDSSGGLVWAKGVGGTNSDYGRSIEIDSSGNSYVTGQFQGTADFDPSGVTQNLTSAGSSDIFIAKYDGSGDLVWAKSVGGTSADDSKSIQVDSSGNSYVTGYFDGTVDFDPSGVTQNLTSAGGNDIFIAKYDSNGGLVWAKNLGGTGGDQGDSIQVDSSGNSYAAGNFQGTSDFDPSGVTQNLTSAGGNDAFFAKYDSSGALVWAKNVGGTDYDAVNSIQVDSSGNSYVTGIFQGTADFDPDAGVTNLTSAGLYDTFIAKYDSSGGLVWAKNIGGTENDIGLSVAVDSSGNSYVTGDFKGTADFDPGAGTTNLTSAGARDIFIAKYESSGALVWVKSFGGTSDDQGRSVQVDSSGNVHVTGVFQGTVDFDPGTGTENLTSAGSLDAFLLKLDSGGNFVSVVSVAPSYFLTKKNQTAADIAGTEANHTLVNNSGGTASGALISGTGSGNTVTVTLPAGLSLTNRGTGTAVSGEAAGTSLTGQIQASGTSATNQVFIDQHGQIFLNSLGGAALDIRTVTFSGSSEQTVHFTGTSSGGPEALVIDTSGLTTGSTLQLNHIDFAAILGNATVNGGGGSSYIVGDDAAQRILLSVGNNTIAGGGGSDTVVSGSGDDLVYGNQGFDSLLGGDGMDTLFGGQDLDIVQGGNGNDVLYGNKGNDALWGGEHEDVLYGGQGEDILYGGSGGDLVYGDNGNDVLYGGDGTDTLFGGEDRDILSAGSGSDVLYGDEGNDVLWAGEDDDVLYGGQDRDILLGDGGMDTLFGGQGNDILLGVDGDDRIVGDEGSDVLLGGNGLDTLNGGLGNDRLDGGSGSDYLAGDKGDDTLTGGLGADIFVFNFDGGNDQVTDFQAGTDTLALQVGLGVSGSVEMSGNTVVTFSDGGTVTVIGIPKIDLAAATGWDLG
ncbi:SBBP repeat-containing protein [Nisaea nitritireducens]|uniref:SBBP repeat-containing protein n=1 Tax=Nisaea nitritireducens TaxID=568392 RepID=UPI001865F8DF|nr:SBBP repeat-containing protein [Nisaea nitritireducens]